jgi:general secretion pathway protein D
MKKEYRRLILLCFVSFATLLLVSCELLEKKEETKTENQGPLFPVVDKPLNSTVASIDSEAVVLKNRISKSIAPLEVVDSKKLDHASMAERKPALPFYEKYLKGKDDKIPIFIDLDAVSIHDIIPAFASLLAFNYSVEPTVKGAITLKIQDSKAKDNKVMMTRRDVWKLFNQVLWMAGAYCSPEDDILHIMPFKKMSRERKIFAAKGNAANVSVRIINIRNVSAKSVLANITDFLTEGAEAKELSGENALLIVETPDNMPKLLHLIEMLDSKRRSRWPRIVVRCANVTATQIMDELARILPVLGFTVSIDKDVPEPGSIHLTSIIRMRGIVASAANKEALEEVRKWITMLDRSDIGEQEQVYVYKVVNGRAEELLQALATVFAIDGTSLSVSHSAPRSSTNSSGSASVSPARSSTKSIKSSSRRSKDKEPESIYEIPVKMFADGKDNRLLVRTTPRTYAMIKALLHRLDTVPVQVLLQVMIAEIRLNENTEFGVEFSGVTQLAGKRGLFGTNYSGLIPQRPARNLENGFKYLVMNGDDKFAYIRGLAGTGNFKVLSSPQLAATSGTQALFEVGQEIPIITRTLADNTNVANNLSTSNEVEYKKTGIILKITPQVTKGGLITLDLDQTVSNRGEDVSAGGSSYPSFINRQVVTSLSMKDKETVIVSGIIQETDRSSNDSMPFVAKVPLLATLFGYSKDEVQRTELLILITSTIISNETNLQKMLDRYKQSVALIRKFNEEVKKRSKE